MSQPPSTTMDAKYRVPIFSSSMITRTSILTTIVFLVTYYSVENTIRKMSRVEFELIVPDVIDALPQHSIKINYGSLSVEYGNIVLPSQVKDTPTNVSWPAEDGSLYTLMMVDPDVPSRKVHFLKEFNHWLVVNIMNNNITSGHTVVPYMGAKPTILTGIHRYIFLVFKQKDQISTESTRRPRRWRFATRKFIESHQLGQAIAMNFFRSKYEPSNN